jgi:hypothetical protein
VLRTASPDERLEKPELAVRRVAFVAVPDDDVPPPRACVDTDPAAGVCEPLVVVPTECAAARTENPAKPATLAVATQRLTPRANALGSRAGAAR